MNFGDCDVSIAVVIPTYNRATLLMRAVRSVLNQSIEASEIIVVDDGSKDKTADIISEAAKQDPRIKYYLQIEHRGAQAARNRGIKEAKSNWITFLDSDDMWLPHKLEEQLKALKCRHFNRYTVVHGDCIVQKTEEDQSVWHVPVIHGTDVYKTLLEHPGPLFPTLLVSKKALEKIDCLDEHVPAYQEWDTVIRLSKICQFVHIPKPLFVYCLHEGITISKDHTKDIEGYQYILDKYKKDILAIGGISVWCRHIYRQYHCCLQFGFKNRAEDYHRVLCKEIRSALQDMENFARKYDIIYCYGAGYVGQMLGALLKDWGIELQAYLLSDGESLPKESNCTDICYFSTIRLMGSSGIFIGTTEKNHAFIKKNLQAYPNIDVYPVMDDIVRVMAIYSKVKEVEKCDSRDKV